MSQRIEREPNPPPILKQLIAQMEVARKHNRIAMVAFHAAGRWLGLHGPQQEGAYTSDAGDTVDRYSRRGKEPRAGRDASGNAEQKASASATKGVDNLRQVIAFVQDVMTRMP
jgi:hypothetical protein